MLQRQSAIDYVKKNFNTYLEDLKTLVRIPSVSFDGFPPTEVEKSANAVAELLKKRGLENVQILKLGKAHPYVYAERLQSSGQAHAASVRASRRAASGARRTLEDSSFRTDRERRARAARASTVAAPRTTKPA